jgi:Sec-independent protein translocase protein TatA
MGRGLGKGLREFKESVSGDHKESHGFDESKLQLSQEMTAAPIGGEPVTATAVSVETEKAA